MTEQHYYTQKPRGTRWHAVHTIVMIFYPHPKDPCNGQTRVPLRARTFLPSHPQTARNEKNLDLRPTDFRRWKNAGQSWRRSRLVFAGRNQPGNRAVFAGHETSAPCLSSTGRCLQAIVAEGETDRGLRGVAFRGNGTGRKQAENGHCN
jgi:hypothetical protein